MTIGEKIKDSRQKAGVSQKALAKKLDITYSVISQWETGKRIPKLGTLRRIAKALGINVTELFDLPPENKEAILKLETGLLDNEKKLKALRQNGGPGSDEEIANLEQAIPILEEAMENLILPAKLEHQAELARRNAEITLAAQEHNKGAASLLQEKTVLQFQGISPEQKKVCMSVCQIVSSPEKGKALGEFLSAYEKLNDTGRAELIKRSLEMLYIPSYTKQVEE